MIKIDELANEFTLNTPIHTKHRSMDWANDNLKLLAHYAYVDRSNSPSGLREYGFFYSPILGVVTSREITNEGHLHVEPNDSMIMLKPALTLNDATVLASKWYSKIKKDRGHLMINSSPPSPPSASSAPSAPVVSEKKGQRSKNREIAVV